MKPVNDFLLVTEAPHELTNEEKRNMVIYAPQEYQVKRLEVIAGGTGFVYAKVQDLIQMPNGLYAIKKDLIIAEG